MPVVIGDRSPLVAASIDSSRAASPSGTRPALISMAPRVKVASAKPSESRKRWAIAAALPATAAASSSSPAASCLNTSGIRRYPRSTDSSGWPSHKRCARPIHALPGPTSPRVMRIIPHQKAHRKARSGSPRWRKVSCARSRMLTYSWSRPSMKAEVASSSRSSASTAADRWSYASLQARLAYASRPCSRSPAGIPDSDPEEAAQRQPRAERADREAAHDEDQRRPRERQRPDVCVILDVSEDLRNRDLPADEQEQDGGDRAREPGQEPLEHERAAHIPVGRADELHHLDLAPSRVHGQPDRVRDQDGRRREENEDRDEEDDLNRAGDREDALGDLLAVSHLVDGSEPRLLHCD